MNNFINFDINRAETIALQAINFILNDDDLQQNFLATSGVSPSEFKGLINDPNFLGGVLDFLLNNETELIRFCETTEIEPTEPARARYSFPGASFDI